MIPRVSAWTFRLAHRYTLAEKLGSGGQGEVWRAYDAVYRQPVALKILRRRLSPPAATPGKCCSVSTGWCASWTTR